MSGGGEVGGDRTYVEGYEVIAGARKPCRVAPEHAEQQVVLHLTTTGGSPFTSVVLELKHSEHLAKLLLRSRATHGFTKRTRWLLGLAAFVVVGVLGFVAGRLTAPVVSISPVAKAVQATTPDPMAEAVPSLMRPPGEPSALNKTVLNYMLQPEYSGGGFELQVIGHDWVLKGQGFNEYQMVFASEIEIRRSELAGFFGDPQTVEFARRNGNEWSFADGSSYTWPEYRTVVQVHASQMVFDPDKALHFGYGRVAYEPRLSELEKYFVERKTVLWFRGLEALPKAGNTVVANHGAYVARPKEPSLVRLCERLVRYGDAKERPQKIQFLLDFVTNNILYNDTEALADFETLKAPNEVLMTGTSDCSGQTILFASLLEQLGVDYFLGYTSDHITVYVAATGFELSNGYEIEVDGVGYTQAECTVKDFQIGRTKLQTPIRAADIEILQRPREKFVRDGSGKVIEETLFQ